MQCHSHPNAPAIENCAKCNLPLCGMCANFTDSGVLCEKCVEIVETEKFVTKQSEEFEKPAQTVHVERDEPEEQQAGKKKPFVSAQQAQIMIIVACFAIMGARLAFFSGSDFQPIDDETRARELAITSFANCLLVFRRIGEVLADGDTPPASLRCDDSGAQNIVTQTGNEVRVSHPHPDFYGYSEIYVSSSNPEPVVVD